MWRQYIQVEEHMVVEDKHLDELWMSKHAYTVLAVQVDPDDIQAEDELRLHGVHVAANIHEYILNEKGGPKEDECIMSYQSQGVSVWEGAEVVHLQAEYSSRSSKIFSRILANHEPMKGVKGDDDKKGWDAKDHNVPINSVKRKTSKDGNWDSQEIRWRLLPRKINIWSGRKDDSPKRNVVFSHETKLHYFNRDDMEFDDMEQVVKEAQHENASRKNVRWVSMVLGIS
nr:hypothetical protein [Tanacetum cinerariifolium]